MQEQVQELLNWWNGDLSLKELGEIVSTGPIQIGVKSPIRLNDLADK